MCSRSSDELVGMPTIKIILTFLYLKLKQIVNARYEFFPNAVFPQTSLRFLKIMNANFSKIGVRVSPKGLG